MLGSPRPLRNMIATLGCAVALSYGLARTIRAIKRRLGREQGHCHGSGFLPMQLPKLAFQWVTEADYAGKYLKLLASPAGFEPALPP